MTAWLQRRFRRTILRMQYAHNVLFVTKVRLGNVHRRSRSINPYYLIGISNTAWLNWKVTGRANEMVENPMYLISKEYTPS